MAEIVTIASLTINIDDVAKESARLRQEIDKIKASQKELDTSTDEGAAAYARQDAQIKNLTKSYRDNQKLLASVDAANQDLNKTLSAENKTRLELLDSRNRLNEISKSIRGNTEDEIKLREQLNTAIDAQTTAIREQSSEFNEQKDEIGEYKQGVLDANMSLGGLITASEEAGGATELLSNTATQGARSIGTMTKAAISFIATPLGAVLAIIAGVIGLVSNAMNRNEESAAKMQKIFAAFSGVVKGLLKVLEPLGEYLIDGIVRGFEMVEKVVTSTISGIEKALRFIGLDEAADSLNNFTSQVGEVVTASKQLVEAELALNEAQRQGRKVQLEYQAAAEKLRQTRDDETKSVQERIKANEDLGRVLQAQLKEEESLAQKSLEYANLQAKINGDTKESRDAVAAAETELADIRERILGQESEQLVNANSLRKELAEQNIAALNAEVDAYIAAQGARAASTAEAIAAERTATDMRKNILAEELSARIITQQEYNAQVAALDAELSQKQAQLVVDNTQRELDAYIAKNQSRIESEKFLSEEVAAIESNRLNAIAEKQREFEATRLEQGVITQQEYNDAINTINAENDAANDALREERAQAERDRLLEDAANRYEILRETSDREFDALYSDLERNRLAEIEAAEKTGADTALINAKYAAQKNKIDKSVTDSQINGFGEVATAFSSALGEQTKAGKAAAIAAALIDTYKSATAAYSSLAGIPIIGPALGAAAAAAAVVSGIKNVQQITATPTEFAQGGILDGASHASGGIPFTIRGRGGFEAEGGEAIINKVSTARYRPLLSAINVAGGGKRFATGGIVGSTNFASSGTQLIDYAELAQVVIDGVASQPPQQLSITEFNKVSDSLKNIEAIATS